MKQDIREVVQGLMAMRLHEQVSEAAYIAWMNCGLLGTKWKHFRTQNYYLVVGFSYCSTSDEWAIQYQRVDNLLPFTRPISNAFSRINDATSEMFGVWRFEQAL